MMTKFMFLRKALAMLTLAAAAVSCSKDSDIVAPTEQGHLITFDVVDELATRGAINSTFTEFWVYAVDSKGEVVLDDVKYTLTGGKWKAEKDCYSLDSEIDFYFYTPNSDVVTSNAESLTYAMPTDVVAQPDILVGSTLDANPAEAVKLQFNRAGALLKFAVSGECDYAIQSVEVSNIIDNGTVNKGTMAWTTNGSASSTSYFAGIKSGVTNGGEGTDITNETGYLMVIPQTAAPVITVINTNGTEKKYELTGQNWKAGKIYPYTIGIDNIEPEDVVVVEPEDDYTDKDPSNCYIVNPKSGAQRVYNFPVEVRVNDYWGNYANVAANKLSGDLAGLTIEQLWSDCNISPSGTGADDLGVTLIIDKNNKVAMQVVVPADYTKMGNAVYAVKKNGSILWSWHLWVTDYAPTGDQLNRYVGQKNETSISGAMLYQFGRKDPFRSTARISNSNATIMTGVLNPTTAYYVSDYNWATDFNRYVYWADVEQTSRGKSIFDPSPYGYMVADYTHMKQYNNLSGFDIFGSYYIYTKNNINTYFCFTTDNFATDYKPITNKEARMWMSNPTGYSIGANASTYRMYDYTSIYGEAYVFEKQDYSANSFFPVFSIAE